jgi:glycine reductase
VLRVAHYINQFFGGRGGEQVAGMPPEVRSGPVGPGRIIQQLLGADGEVCSTLVCGDNFFHEHHDAAARAVEDWLKTASPHLVVAGPAFAAGRYGAASAQVCAIAELVGIAAVSGMHPENPGRVVNPHAYVVATPHTATGMGAAMRDMLSLGRKLAAGEMLGPAAVGGYLPRGVRRPGLREHSGAERAVDMLVAKLRGNPFQTEIPVEGYDKASPAAPVVDLKQAKIALVTTGAIVPRGNPDHLKRCSETRWKRYRFGDMQRLSTDDFECVHGGFHNVHATHNPNMVVPLDVMRELQREGVFADLLDSYLATSGNDMRLTDCQRNGREMAEVLRSAHVDATLLVAT